MDDGPIGRLNEKVTDFAYTIYMVAAGGPRAVDSLAKDAESRVKDIGKFKREHAKQLAAQNIRIKYGRYDHLPAFHGILINDQHLFLGHLHWTDKGKLEGLTVPHFYFNKEEDLGRPFVAYFESWWRYLEKRAKRR